MSNCLRTVLCISQCLLFSSQFYALPGVSLPVLNNVAVGATVTPNISVTGFSNIASAQFVLVWDPQVLEFQGIEDFNLTGLPSNAFGTAEVAQGILRFGWASGNGSGVPMSNGATLFSIQFHVVGAVQTGSAMNITELSPTAFEIVQVENGQFASYALNNMQVTQGFVAVGYTVSTHEVPGHAALPLTLAPNPFQTSTSAQFFLAEAGPVTITIADAAGRLLRTELKQLSAGSQSLDLMAPSLPAKGTYFITVRTPVQSCTKPLSFL